MFIRYIALLLTLLSGVGYATAQQQTDTYRFGRITGAGSVGITYSYRDRAVQVPATSMLAWNVSGGAPTTCTIHVDGSTDNVTWTTLLADTSCAATGTGNFAMGSNTYFRVVAPTYVASSATNWVDVSYVGYTFDPNAQGVTDATARGLAVAAQTAANTAATNAAIAQSLASGALQKSALPASAACVGTDANKNPITGTCSGGVNFTPTATTPLHVDPTTKNLTVDVATDSAPGVMSVTDHVKLSGALAATGLGNNVPTITLPTVAGDCAVYTDAAGTMGDSGSPCNSRAFTTLSSFIGTCASGCARHLVSTLSVPTSYTTPNNSVLTIEYGAGISIASGAVLTFGTGSYIVAGDFTFFTGPGLPTGVAGLSDIMWSWFGAKSNAATMTAAINECNTLPSIVFCKITSGNGRINSTNYAYNNVISRSYMEITGAGSGSLDSNTLPTTIVGGTTFYPGLNMSGSHIVVKRIGVDAGTVVNPGAITAAFTTSCTNGNTAACGTDEKIDDVLVLGPDTGGTCQHAALFEGYSYAYLNNVRTFFCQDGSVFKLTKSQISNFISQGHTTAYYLKSDTYAAMQDSEFTNMFAGNLATGDTPTAYFIQSTGIELSGLTMNGIVASGTGGGLNFNGISSTSIVRRPVINGFTTRGVTGQAVLGTGYVDGALINGTTLNATGSLVQITQAANPNVQGIVFNGVNADSTSGGGYLNTLNSRIYNANVNVKSYGALPLPSPTYRANIITASETPWTVANTQYGMCPNCFQTISTTVGSSIIGAWITFSQLPVGCIPIIYAWDNTQGALGVQMTISGTASGVFPAVIATGVPYHFYQASYNSLLQVPAGNSVGLEQRGGTLACTTPAIISGAQLEYQTF